MVFTPDSPLNRHSPSSSFLTFDETVGFAGSCTVKAEEKTSIRP